MWETNRHSDQPTDIPSNMCKAICPSFFEGGIKIAVKTTFATRAKLTCAYIPYLYLSIRNQDGSFFCHWWHNYEVWWWLIKLYFSHCIHNFIGNTGKWVEWWIKLLVQASRGPQSPDKWVSWAFVARGFISMINQLKWPKKLQKDWNSKTLTFAPTFYMWTMTLTKYIVKCFYKCVA